MVAVFRVNAALGVASSKTQEANEAREKASNAEGVAKGEAAKAKTALCKESAQRRLLRKSYYATQIKLAAQYVRGGDFLLAEQALNACPTDLCGWEFHYLWDQIDRRVRIVTASQTHQGPLEFPRSTMSPDGNACRRETAAGA